MLPAVGLTQLNAVDLRTFRQQIYGNAVGALAVLIVSIVPNLGDRNLKSLGNMAVGDGITSCSRAGDHRFLILRNRVFRNGVGNFLAVSMLFQILKLSGPVIGGAEGQSLSSVSAVCQQLYGNAYRTEAGFVIFVIPDLVDRNIYVFGNIGLRIGNYQLIVASAGTERRCSNALRHGYRGRIGALDPEVSILSLNIIARRRLLLFQAIQRICRQPRQRQHAVLGASLHDLQPTAAIVARQGKLGAGKQRRLTALLHLLHSHIGEHRILAVILQGDGLLLGICQIQIVVVAVPVIEARMDRSFVLHHIIGILYIIADTIDGFYAADLDIAVADDPVVICGNGVGSYQFILVCRRCYSLRRRVSKFRCAPGGKIPLQVAGNHDVVLNIFQSDGDLLTIDTICLRLLLFVGKFCTVDIQTGIDNGPTVLGALGQNDGHIRAGLQLRTGMAVGGTPGIDIKLNRLLSGLHRRVFRLQTQFKLNGIQFVSNHIFQ